MADYSHDEFVMGAKAVIPELVVKPHNTRQVSGVLKLANSMRFPVIPRGGATGLCGGCVPVPGGVVLSLERMKGVAVDRDNIMAEAEAGVPLVRLYEEVEKGSLFFPPHPGDESAQLGGVVATNAGGSRALKYGVVRDFVRGLEVVLPTGKIINVGGKTLKNSAGYSLLNLFIGSEGTLGVITKVILRLLPPPGALSTLVVPFESSEDAIGAVPELIRSGIIPMAVEFLEREIVPIAETSLQKKWPVQEGQAYLMLIIDGANSEELDRLTEGIGEVCLRMKAIDVYIAQTKEKQAELLDFRSKLYEVLKPYLYEILDITVPLSAITSYLRVVQEISHRFNVWLPTYGHAGDGNLHTHIMKGRPQGNTIEGVDGLEKFFPAIEERLHHEGLAHGGTISGEHGIGIVKKAYLEKAFSAEYIGLLKGIKNIFDPNNIMNPGKIF